VGKQYFWGISGALALLCFVFNSSATAQIYGFFIFGPLALLTTALPSLWLASATFALLYEWTGRHLRSHLHRLLAALCMTVAIGFSIFIGIPKLSNWVASHRAETILAKDVAPPESLKPIRTIEINLIGDQSGNSQHFGPGGCFGLCIDLLAAGVLDRVVIHSEAHNSVVSREDIKSGCHSNVFGRKKSIRDLRLRLAGYCIVYEDLTQEDTTDFNSDITFTLTNHWATATFKMRQIQAFDSNAKLLMQKSYVEWQENLDFRLDSLVFPNALSDVFGKSPPNTILRKKGQSPLPFNWMEIAALSNLPKDNLHDIALTLPNNPDPSIFPILGVRFSMLENLAFSDEMTESELKAYAAYFATPNWLPSNSTTLTLRRVLSKHPNLAVKIAVGFKIHALRRIQANDFQFDPLLLQTLTTLIELVPSTSLPPELANLSAKDLINPTMAELALVISATKNGAPSNQYLLPLFKRVVSVSSRPMRTDGWTDPQLGFDYTQRLNAAICLNAAFLPPDAGEDWLSWVSHHAANFPEDHVLAEAFGQTAAQLNLDQMSVLARFTEFGWSQSEMILLNQPTNSSCPQ
jgi:hypothetical protein